MEKDAELDQLRNDQRETKKKINDLEDQIWHANQNNEVSQIKLNESDKLLKEYELRLDQLVDEADQARKRHAREIEDIQ